MSLVTAYGESLLYEAVSMGHEAIVEMLLDHGASVEFDALQEASTWSHDHFVQRLLSAFDIERGDDQGRTALHRACDVGHLDLFQVLLNRGSDFRVLDGQNRTCLHHAASGGSVKILKRLLEEGLDPT